MARIHVHDNRGGTLAIGEVGVNSRTRDRRQMLAGPFDNALQTKPTPPTVGDENIHGYVNNIHSQQKDSFVIFGTDPNYVVMVENGSVERGTSLHFFAKAAFALMIEDIGTINGSTAGNAFVVNVPIDSRIEIYKQTNKNWTAELVDSAGVRTPGVVAPYVPT